MVLILAVAAAHYRMAPIQRRYWNGVAKANGMGENFEMSLRGLDAAPKREARNGLARDRARWGELCGSRGTDMRIFHMGYPFGKQRPLPCRWCSFGVNMHQSIKVGIYNYDAPKHIPDTTKRRLAGGTG